MSKHSSQDLTPCQPSECVSAGDRAAAGGTIGTPLAVTKGAAAVSCGARPAGSTPTTTPAGTAGGSTPTTGASTMGPSSTLGRSAGGAHSFMIASCSGV